MCLFFRDRVYIYYSAFTFSFIFATFAINSFDLFLNVQFQNRNFFLLSYLSVLFFLSLFIGEVLQTNKNMPWIEGALKISRLILVTIGIMTTFNESHVSYVLVATIPASMLFLPILVAASRQGAPYAKTLMVGVMLLISGAMTTVLVNKGVLPKNEVTVHGILIGSITEMVIFSVTLFRRVIDSNAEAQSALSAMAEHASTKLENTVIARTRELNQAKQAAEQANENRRDFFSNINHEMRTPLNGILGIIGVIGQQDEKTVSVQHFKTLKIASHQLSNLVSNVLDHSRLSSNAALEIQSIHFNILDIVNELEDMFYNMADDKGLSLSFHVQGDLMLDRYGDYGKLRQILINIMGNAIKFTHSGQVGLTVLQGSSEGELMFSITDTGDGIEEAHIERIYTAYHQVPGSNGFQKTGSGLGLSISKTLTIVMGGTLNVKSNINRGTQFDCVLPLKPVIVSHKKM
jgi:signal transduction histidine kinase